MHNQHKNLPPAVSISRYLTQIKAVDPVDGELKTWWGPWIYANSYEDAQDLCQEMGLGYCEVVGKDDSYPTISLN